MSEAQVVRGAGRRVRRPKDLENLQERLRDSATFETFSEAFVLCGLSRLFSTKADSISKIWRGCPVGGLCRRAGGEEIVNILAVVETGELEVLGDGRLEERLRIFEEYLHSGKIIEAELKKC